MTSIFSHGHARGIRRPLAATALGVALVGLGLLSGAAIAGYNIWTGEYTFTKQELQRAVESRFPATLRYAQVLDVRLTRPRLTLDAAGNRVTTQVDAQLTNSLLPAPPVNGTLALNSGLRYDPVKRAVLLDNPTVEQVQVEGVPGQYSAQLNAVGNLVAQELLKDYPLHTFKPEELQVNGKHVEPGAITVTEDGIAVKIDTK
ncbi:DUF1439 domain-containing protein [Cupriavidus gilardii]|uniref:DUF1439 domain-containing protein n=1 Tax=Cupriavidus gilardii TaxID=82541 RepID=UPI001EE53FDD|nr:DUF1439 domain-containing protein [Cupriavidus gilardii]MCG5262024.1 DUF1439 domain-containing protein [Cupriavidus gilardii]MDF9430635.1 DUF1439 domain-containing protein [Cupriavidus gilardii]